MGEINDSTTRYLERKIAECQDRMIATEPVWNKSFEAPGAFVTGRSNRPQSLNKMVDRENNRMMSAFTAYQEAKKKLAFYENRLKLYRAGEVYSNGQPRADAPSRKQASDIKMTISDFFRSLIKPGDLVAVAMNPVNKIQVKRVNKKSITDEMGERWEYSEIIPLGETGEAMTKDEIKLAYRQFTS